MGEVIDRVGAFRLEIPVHRPAMEELVRSIIYQQLTGKAAATILGRFLGLFGGRFPSAVRMGEMPFESLRGVGLSRQKAAAIGDLSARAQDGSLRLKGFDEMSDEAIIRNLIQVKGIGEWSAQMFLIFHLGRLNVWPAGDYAIQRASGLLRGSKGLPNAKEMARLGARYEPFATIASYYLWASVD